MKIRRIRPKKRVFRPKKTEIRSLFGAKRRILRPQGSKNAKMRYLPMKKTAFSYEKIHVKKIITIKNCKSLTQKKKCDPKCDPIRCEIATFIGKILKLASQTHVFASISAKFDAEFARISALFAAKIASLERKIAFSEVIFRTFHRKMRVFASENRLF
jgi:hypothetical protein